MTFYLEESIKAMNIEEFDSLFQEICTSIKTRTTTIVI